MTKTELKAKWEQLISVLYEKLDKVKVDTFFKPLTPSKLSEKEGKIYALSQAGTSFFFQGRMDSYKRDLEDATTDIFGKKYTIVIVENEPNIPEEEDIYTFNDIKEESQLNPEYNFENFVAGLENQFPLAACLAVADNFSKAYNPLFIYGGSGLGKTHLMHAIGNYVLKKHPKKKVLYVSAESFTNELITAIGNQTTSKFKSKFRNIDYLLFDDVQFIAGKKSTEEELFNTFEVLYNKGKQIVFTSDKAPSELENFQERLSSRFACGLTVGINPPGYESKMAILKNKASLMDLDINNKHLLESLDLIAQSDQDNVRELEGAFKRVVTYAAFINKEITPELVKEVLSEFFKNKEKEVTPDLIKKTVADYFGIRISEIESKKRSRNIAYPRQIAIYLIREYTDYSYPQIALCFGGQNHTSIMYSYNKVCADIDNNNELRFIIDKIKERLK